MTGSPETASRRIFISYRREETAYAAGWLFNRLADEFGAGQVFKDVDSIELGDDFVEVINSAVGSTDVLLALIGDEWLTITDEAGSRRLDDPDDFVRLEIEAALARKVRVIPILVDGARMPRAEELPPSLAPLARRQALELSPSRFEFDTSRLLKVLDKTLGAKPPPKDAATSAAAMKASAPSGVAAGQTAERGHVSAGRPPTAGMGTLGGRFARPRVLIGAGVLIACLVIALVIAVVIANSDSPTQDVQDDPSRTAQGEEGAAEAIPFVDDFSSRRRGWDDVGDTQTGGHYRNGAYFISAERERPAFHTLTASPRDASSAANVRIRVDARRVGGTAQLGYGYGIFCRANGGGNLYIFAVWGRHAEIAKYIDGEFVKLSEPAPSVHSAVQGDTRKQLEAVCTNVNGGNAVDLQMWADGELILRETDAENPIKRGTFGLQATLGPSGEIGDTLEVRFDNFEVSEE
jgi:hypothetical protein